MWSDGDDTRTGGDDHGAGVSAVAVRADGRVGASGSLSGEIRLWDLQTGRLVAVSEPNGFHADPVSAIVFTGDGRLMVTRGHELALWTPVADKLVADALYYGDGPLASLCVSADGADVLLGDAGTVRRWTVAPGGPAESGGHIEVERSGRPGEGVVQAVAMIAGGAFATGTSTGGVRAWNAASFGGSRLPEPLWSYAEDVTASQQRLSVCDDGRLVVSPRDGRLVALDARSGTVVASVEGVPPRVTAAAAHPRTSTVVVAAADGVLTWWNARTADRMGAVHAGPVRALTFAPDSTGVMAVSSVGVVALWRPKGSGASVWLTPASVPTAGELYREHPWDLTTVVGTANSRHWLVGGRGGQTHILRWTPGDAALALVRRGVIVDPCGGLDGAALGADLRRHRVDPEASRGAVRTLAGADAAELPDLGSDVKDALGDLALAAEDRVLGEDALVLLARAGHSAAVSTCHALLNEARWRPEEGVAGRLLARLTGVADPSTQSLIDGISDVGILESLLRSYALAERGAAAVPQLHAALRSFPLPADPASPRWMSNESAKYRLLAALACIGPPAVEAVAAILTLREDDGGYRDTRWIADRALEAICGTAYPERPRARPGGPRGGPWLLRAR